MQAACVTLPCCCWAEPYRDIQRHHHHQQRHSWDPIRDFPTLTKAARTFLHFVCTSSFFFYLPFKAIIGRKLLTVRPNAKQQILPRQPPCSAARCALNVQLTSPRTWGTFSYNLTLSAGAGEKEGRQLSKHWRLAFSFGCGNANSLQSPFGFLVNKGLPLCKIQIQDFHTVSPSPALYSKSLSFQIFLALCLNPPDKKCLMFCCYRPSGFEDCKLIWCTKNLVAGAKGWFPRIQVLAPV